MELSIDAPLSMELDSNESIVAININSLPNETLQKIFGNLNIFDRINCGRVCERWDTAITEILHKELAFNFGHHLPICADDDHRIHNPKTMAQYYKTINSDDDETDMIHDVISQCPNLKSMQLYVRKKETIYALMEYNHQIECLTLVSFDDKVMIASMDLITKYASSLKHLKICDETRYITHHNLRHLMVELLSKCTMLEIVQLKKIEMDPDCCGVLPSKIKSLNVEVNVETIQALGSRNENDRLLNIVFRKSFINNKRLKIICENFRNVKRLVIDTFTDNGNFSSIRHIGQLTYLEELEIQFMPIFFNNGISIDNELSDVFKNCSQLQKITLCNGVCVSIGDDTFTAMAQWCPKLNHIHFWRLGNINQITDIGINMITQLFKLNYIILNAIYCNRHKCVVKKWMQKIVVNCPKITYANIMDIEYKKNDAK